MNKALRLFNGALKSDSGITLTWLSFQGAILYVYREQIQIIVKAKNPSFSGCNLKIDCVDLEDYSFSIDRLDFSPGGYNA